MTDVHPSRVESFLRDFAAWAASQPDILGVALVGSYARDAATESSDADLVILARDPKNVPARHQLGAEIRQGFPTAD